MAQEPCLDMAIIYVYIVLAVLVHGGQSTACQVDWMIADPPIIFGKTAQLSCVTVTSNISSYTNNVIAWLGGKNYSVLTYSSGTADTTKYGEIQKRYRGKFEFILQIHKFDEMDVNVDYACSIEGCENRKMLSLTPDKFEYHPDKNTTRVQTNFRNGYLDVIVKIIKVYPIPKCTIMFNENIISRGLTTKIGVNGIFYIVVQEVDKHYFDVCSGQLIVTCVVGKTEITIHQETFNRCRKTKVESPEYSNNLIIYISAGVVVFGICVMGMSCLVKYGNFACCSVCRSRDERILLRHLAQLVKIGILQAKKDAANDTGLEEEYEEIYPRKQ